METKTLGFLRDAGAALTMGISATTKHKEAERGYKERETLHDQVIARFNEDVVRTSEAIDALESEYLSARDAIINSQALRVDENGNIGYGWYGPFDSTHADNDGPNMQQSAIGSAPAFVAAIGTPAAVWTLAGALGTAGTGVAISSLSGAAAGAATAAWIGRAATLGLGGMTAGRFALGPSALASLPVQAAIGAKIAGNRERKAIANYDAAVQEMDRRETIAARCTPYLQEYRPSARQMTTTMARHTHQLETSDVGGQPAQDAVTRLAVDMEQAESLIRKFAETIEQAQSEFNP
jgi:hypothetical protein